MRSKGALLPGSVILLIVLAAALAQAALAAEPVGAKITAINAKTGVVTANETATGRMLQFKVADAALLKSLKVGLKISGDLHAMTVTLPAARPGAKAVQVRILKAEPVGRPAEPVGQTGQAAQSTASQGRLGTGGRPPTKLETPGGDPAHEKACKEAGGEWRCTVVSTGSKPGPEDDVVSCHCIRTK